MTVSLKEVDEIIELVNKHNIKLCVAHPARYSSAFLQMKKMIENGEIGIPLTIHGRGKSDHRGGGEDMMVLGTHILDLEIFFFGQPQYVWAEVRYEGKPIVKGDICETVEPIGPTSGDNIFASFNFSNGVRGLFESRQGLFKQGEQSSPMGIAVIGTEGTLSLRFDDYRDVNLKISRSKNPPDADACFEDVEVKDGRIIVGAAPLDKSLCGRHTPNASWFLESNRYGVWDLMRSIEEDRQPISNMYNARTVLEMIYGIYASQLFRKAIDFPLAARNNPLDI
jgi:predicted dehydrogenase